MSKEFDIKEWQDIEGKGWNSLLLGNGASIAVSKKFSYGTLYEVAEKEGMLRNAKNIFEKLNTTDFERALLACWYAKVINESLVGSSNIVDCAYENIRTALIGAVKKVHSPFRSVSGHLKQIHNFMSAFRAVFSLNYDLIVYWAIMEGNKKCRFRFKDCFIDGIFCDNVDRISIEYPSKARGLDTLVFYPHGNLILAEDFSYNERKMKVDGGGDLLTTIGREWKENNLKPVFVSEGTSSEKLASIGRSRYLTIVYERLIPAKVGEGLVVYGWGMQENDRHILDAIKLSAVQRMAVSVFRSEKGSEKGSEKALDYCRHVKDSLEKADIDVEPEFFWSDSAGCWNNPKEG